MKLSMRGSQERCNASTGEKELTRKTFLLATFGGTLAGCGGSGIGGPDTVFPTVQVYWNEGNSRTRTSTIPPLLPAPMGTRSVVITFVGASVLRPGEDVIVRVNRPAAQTLPVIPGEIPGGIFYASVPIVSKEAIFRRETEIRIEAYTGPDSTGKLFQRATVSGTPRERGELYNLQPRYEILREKVTGIQLSVDNSRMVIGQSQPLKITYSYPPSVQEILEPLNGEVNLDVKGIFQSDSLGSGYSIRTQMVTVPNSFGNLAVTVHAVRPGPTSITVEADGVKSNTLEIEVV